MFFITFVCFIFFFFLFLGKSNNVDYVEVSGTPFEVGKQLGEHMKEVIIKFYELKKEEYKNHIDTWEKIADLSWKAITAHCPTSAEEMRGMAEVDGITLKMLTMLNTEFELSMSQNTATSCGNGSIDCNQRRIVRKCTGFASMTSGFLVSGQTNDENWNSMLGLEGMIVQKRNKDSLIFTHHGYMMWMGMNDVGLAVLDQYIDNGEYWIDGEFIPSSVALREILTMDSIFEVARFLKDSPRATPLNYIISRPGEGIMNIELSPTNYSILYLPQVELEGKYEDLCHTNHLLYNNAMMDHDIGYDPTSIERYEKCREILKQYRQSGGITVEKGKQLLLTSPIQRDGKWNNVVSAATMIFDPHKLEMFIKYYGVKNFNSYSL